MTIASTARKAGPLLGNGSATTYPFGFKVFATGDIKVAIADSAGVETPLVEGTDYSVSLNANQETSPGGIVTYPVSGSPLPTGSVLSIIGDLDYDQPLDLPSGGNFNPLALENQLDRTVMQMQQLKEAVDRSAKLPQTSQADADELSANLMRLAGSADNIDTVATGIAAVNTVADDLNEPVSEINTVAGSIGNVNAVGTDIANVNAVAGNIASVNAVAGNATNINAVNANKTNIDAVAGNATNINAVVANLADIQNAPENAALVVDAIAQAVDGEKQLFLAGTNYTKGVTTQLTLTYTPAKSGTVSVIFDGIEQHLTEWSLADKVITFAAAIPADKVEVHYHVPSQFVGLSGADLTVLGSAQSAAQAGAAVATSAAASAVLAKTAAEAARDATVVGAAPTVYATTAAGLAATTSGEYFSVPSADADQYLILYLNNAGVAAEQKRYPGVSAVRNLSNVVGASSFDSALVLQGTTTPDSGSFTPSASTIVNDEALTSGGILSAVSVRVASAGTGEIHVFKPAGSGNYTLTRVIPVSVSAGVQRFSIENGRLPVGVKVNAGGMVGYKAITGGLRYAAGGQFWEVNTGPGAVGSLCYRFGNNPFTAAIALEVLADAKTTNGRLDAIENADPAGLALQLGYAPQKGVSSFSLGDTSPNANVLGASIVAPVEVSTRDGLLESVSCRLNASGTLCIEAYAPVGDGSFECVGSWPTSVPVGGLYTFYAGDGVIPAGFWIKKGGFAAVNTIGPLTARLKYASGSGGWVNLTGGGGLGSVSSRNLNTNGFVVAVAFSYRGSEASVDSRLIELESSLPVVFENAIAQALLRVGVNYGISPTLTERAAYAIGDSTVAAYAGGTAIMGLIGTSRAVVDVSVPGHTINQQLAAWNALTIDPAKVGLVIVQVGLNDLDPAESASAAIGRLQALIDRVQMTTGAATKVFISQMVPCRQRLINLYGATNGPISYQKWLDMNASISGTGATPITNVDARITAHVPLMDDGSGNLKPEYDTGDGIHPNTAGRKVNATAWSNAVKAIGLVL